MTVGMMISPIRSVPPTGGIISAPGNLVVEISDGLVARGNTVYLFAALGSKSKATVCDFGITPTSLRQHAMTEDEFEERVMYDEALLFQNMIALGLEKTIDLYHLHQVLGIKPLITSAPDTCRFVITLHDPIEGANKDALMDLSTLPNVWFVSVSKSQQQGARANFIGTVPHGINTALFPFAPQSKGYLAVMGRILPKKGQDDAIVVAHKLNTPLSLVGKYYMDTGENQTYWEQAIAPHIDGKAVIHVPVIPRETLSSYYQKAKALLMPIKWEEPFGLVMIESMSCGTPVVAYNRGSVPEIVKDGVTGFIIDPDDVDRPGKGSWIIKKQGIDGLIEAVSRIGEIDRRACRSHVENNFTLEKMVEGYEQVYAKILASKGDALRS